MEKQLGKIKRYRKSAKILIYLFVFIIIFIGFLVYLLPSVELLNPPEEPPGDPVVSGVIYINGNSELDSFPNKTGTGTPADPYRIENLTINPEENEWGILINGIDKHLVIQNCTVNGSKGAYYGISISSSSNVTVENCEVEDHQIGIYLYNSSYVLINNNSVKHSSQYGISFNQVKYSNITANNVTSNSKYGIIGEWSSNINLLENTVFNNSWSGIRIRDCFYFNISKNRAFENGDRGINCVRTNYTIIAQNNCSRNHGSGMYFYDFYHGKVLDNIAMNNDFCGLFIKYGRNNTIIGNIFLNNKQFDLQLYDSPDHFSENTFETLFIYPGIEHILWLILEFGIFFILLIFGLYTLYSHIKKRKDVKNKIQSEFNVAYSFFLIINGINQLFHVLSKALLLIILDRGWGTPIIRDYFQLRYIETVVGPYIFSLEFQVVYALLLFLVSFLFIIYPTEKYLKKTKKIPFSYFILIAIILLSSTLLIAHFYPEASQVSDFPGILLSILHIITFFAVLVSLPLGIIGFIEFYFAISVRTVGAHRRIAILTIIGFAGWGGAKLLDLFHNEIDKSMSVLILLGPLLFILATPLLRFRRIMPAIISFYQNQRRCVVHRGVIEGKVFLCSNCNVFYCLRCKEALIEMENKCWNCGEPIEKAIIEKPEIESKPEITGPRGESYLIDEAKADLARSEAEKKESKKNDPKDTH